VTPVEPEEAGELQVRGTAGLSLFAEYLNQPEATEQSFDDDGWFRTGDLVTAHADGHLSFANGRRTCSGSARRTSARPRWSGHPGVTGVLEAAVVGRPTTSWTRWPVAFIRAGNGAVGRRAADRVAAECAARGGLQVPRAVYLVRELPRSTLSKVDKKELRAVPSHTATGRPPRTAGSPPPRRTHRETRAS